MTDVTHTIKVTATETYEVVQRDGIFMDYDGATTIEEIISIDKEAFENGDVFLGDSTGKIAYKLEVVKDG